MADSRNDESTSGTGDRRRGFVEFKCWCTTCGVELLVLSKLRGAREPWRVWARQPCPHVSVEQLEAWRFTRRRERDELHLPIRTSTGAAGPRAPWRRGRRRTGTNPRALGTNPRARRQDAA